LEPFVTRQVDNLFARPLIVSIGRLSSNAVAHQKLTRRGRSSRYDARLRFASPSLTRTGLRVVRKTSRCDLDRANGTRDAQGRQGGCAEVHPWKRGHQQNL